MAGYTVFGLVSWRIGWGFVGPAPARFRDFVQRPGESQAFLRATLRRARAVVRSQGDSVPLCITETRWFLHEREEIPARWVKGNDKVRSFSQCDACHHDAARGLYDEDNVVIPGHGRWDD